MGMDIKTIAFFCCSNGLGHFNRVLKICEYLPNNFKIDIYCEKFQYDKFKPSVNANFHFYKISNIRWDKTLNNNKVNFEQYYKWISMYGPVCSKYDIVISDNIVGLLRYNKNIILSGSFLWSDVFYKKFGKNKLTSFDKLLLEENSPVILTNKYLETDSIKKYKNKIQFGFGCSNKKYNKPSKYTPVGIKPSLNYSDKYNDYLINLPFNISEDITICNECVYIVRPGVGMLTHCVENNIPIVALYSNDDSSEIIELAKRVEELNIGIKQNINDDFNLKKYNNLLNNYIYNKDIEKEGYRDIANYIKEL